MEKMSPNNEKKLLKALDKAANLSRSGLEPNHVLTKVANEFKLTPQEIRRVTETYNKAKSVAFLKNASSDFRANDFPLADSEAIIKSVYEKTAEEKVETTSNTPLKNYAAMCSYVKQEKVASEKGCIRKTSCQRDPASFWKEAMAHEDLQNSIRKDLRSSYARTRKALEDSMQKVSEYCENQVHKKDLDKVARLIVNAYGEQGHKFIDDINSRMSKPILPKLEKSAHAAMFPIGEPYVSISTAFVEGEKLVKIARDLECLEKQADAGVLAVLKASDALKEVMKQPPKGRRAEYIDPRTGLSPEWDNYIKALEAKRMLYNLYRFDPIIKSYPLSDVIDVYNELSDLTPSLTHSKAWMRAALRRLLTQGKVADPVELKDMLSGEKERVGASKDYVSMLTNMYGDAEKGVNIDTFKSGPSLVQKLPGVK